MTNKKVKINFDTMKRKYVKTNLGKRECWVFSKFGIRLKVFDIESGEFIDQWHDMFPVDLAHLLNFIVAIIVLLLIGGIINLVCK